MYRAIESSAAWHGYWLGMVKPAQREQKRGEHRADIVSADGCVVEIQHASMSPTKIAGRELDHGHMVWIWDARELYLSNRLELLTFDAGVVRFQWRNQRRNLRACRRPVYLDLWELGNSGTRVVLNVETLDENGFGLGRLVTHQSMRLWMACGIPHRPLLELPGTGGTLATAIAC